MTTKPQHERIKIYKKTQSKYGILILLTKHKPRHQVSESSQLHLSCKQICILCPTTVSRLHLSSFSPLLNLSLEAHQINPANMSIINFVSFFCRGQSNVV